MVGYCHLLVRLGVFDVVELHFGLKGHTHDGKGLSKCCPRGGLYWPARGVSFGNPGYYLVILNIIVDTLDT